MGAPLRLLAPDPSYPIIPLRRGHSGLRLLTREKIDPLVVCRAGEREGVFPYELGAREEQGARFQVATPVEVLIKPPVSRCTVSDTVRQKVGSGWLKRRIEQKLQKVDRLPRECHQRGNSAMELM